jgi:hypothetical protein
MGDLSQDVARQKNVQKNSYKPSFSGALWLEQALGAPVLPREELYALCDVTVESGRRYASRVRSPSPLMFQYYATEYLGT